MNKKLLVVPDTHFSLTNPTNRNKYIEEGLDVMSFIIKSVLDLNIDVVIFLGDIFDRGYDKITQKAFVSFYKKFFELNKIMDGKVFTVLGNHEKTFSKNNPIFNWLKMSQKVEELYKVEKFECKEVLIRAIDALEFENVYIEFNHFDNKKNYSPYSGDKYVIGLFHDSFINVNTTKEIKMYSPHPVDVQKVLDKYNLAIFGHIHIPQEKMDFNNKNKTTVLVPGSMMARTTTEDHEYTELPLIEITQDKDNPIILSSIKYNLPAFSESFSLEKVEENREKYSIKKLIKKNTEIIKKGYSVDEAVIEVGNEKVKNFILYSDNKLFVPSIKLARNYMINKE